MSGHIIVTTTTDTRDVAGKIADGLLSKRLAACIQVMPIDSSYVWEGKTVHAAEFLLLIKARAADYAAIEAEIIVQHSYTVPQITAVPITAGSAAYLAWIDSATAR